MTKYNLLEKTCVQSTKPERQYATAPVLLLTQLPQVVSSPQLYVGVHVAPVWSIRVVHQTSLHPVPLEATFEGIHNEHKTYQWKPHTYMYYFSQYMCTITYFN